MGWVHWPPKPSAGCHPWASGHLLLPPPASSWSRDRVCVQVSSILGGLRGNPWGARGGVGWREERGSAWKEASLVLGDHRALSSPAHEGFWGQGPILTSKPTLICHSHSYGSYGVGVELGVTQEVVSQAGLWHNPTAPAVVQRGLSRESAPWRAPALIAGGFLLLRCSGFPRAARPSVPAPHGTSVP